MPGVSFIDEALMGMLGLSENAKNRIRYLVNTFGYKTGDLLSVAIEDYYNLFVKMQEKQREQQKERETTYYLGPTESSKYKREASFSM